MICLKEAMAQMVKKFSTFIEPSPCPVLNQLYLGSNSLILFFQDQISSYLLLKFPKWSLHLRFSNENDGYKYTVTCPSVSPSQYSGYSEYSLYVWLVDSYTTRDIDLTDVALHPISWCSGSPVDLCLECSWLKFRPGLPANLT
jgi:hypothetical protein